MIIVSDTSPITALLAVREADLLTKIFGEVLVPPAVHSELLRAHQDLPVWLRVQTLQNQAKARVYSQSLDLGEAEAIALAEELHADHLLIDERKGRRLAQQQGVPILGLLGVILIAKKISLIPSARHLLDRLEREAGMYLDQELKNTALRTVGE